MRNFLLKIAIILLGIGFASCVRKTNDQVKIRVVNLEGKPSPVEIKTMDLNIEALQEQGKSSSKYVETQPQAQPQQVINNNQSYTAYDNNVPSGMNFGQPQPENNFTKIVEEKSVENKLLTTPETKKKSGLIYSLKGNASENKDQNNNLFVDESQDAIEIDLSKDDKFIVEKEPAKGSKKFKTKVKKAAKTTKATQNQKEYFVQVGSFANENNAQNSLATMQKFHAGTIKQETVNNAVTNRVLLGPFADKSKARNLIGEIKNSGYDAILIKETN